MPQSVVRGNPITGRANYLDSSNTLVTPTNPRVAVIDPSGTTVLDNQIPTPVSTGQYEFVYNVAADAQLGAWAFLFSGIVDGSPLTGYDTFTVIASGAIVIPGSGAQTCQPWATHEDACVPCDAYGVDPDELDIAMQVASDVLYNLTGRKYPGACTETIWPQAQWSEQFQLPPWWPYVPAFSFCACHQGRRTGCTGVSEIKLPGAPVNPQGITVMIEGDPFTDFSLDDHQYLRRTDGNSWPCCNGFTDDAGWSITFSHGAMPPIGGVKAAALLGCQLALAYNPGLLGDDDDRCKLPDRVTQVVRQGVTLTMLDPEALFDEGKTGIAAVDMWIESERLGNARRRATMIQPSKHRSVRRVGQ